MRRAVAAGAFPAFLAAGVAAVAAVAALAAGVAAGAAPPVPTGASGWERLLGERPSVRSGNRWIVVLAQPSLASRVRRAGGRASEVQERRWTAAARRAQRLVLRRLAMRGVRIQPEHVYLRLLNGFAASLDPRLLPLIERDPGVAGVYPVRTAVPAAALEGGPLDMVGGATAPASAQPGIPGFDGRGVTVALLDTGLDTGHPYVRGRLLEGLDVLDPGAGAAAQQDPVDPVQVERHATELAGLVVGARGPGGMRGIAPGARILPIRVAGWQPDAAGGLGVYARTDQVLAGLELAVDPDQDGDAHDAARIALVGVVEPFAAFPDGPLARAAAGALALDMLVVAPAGNDGPAGPSYGSIGAPGGSPGALTVGAIDSRTRVPTAHVALRAGLRLLLEGDQPLGGVAGPRLTATMPVVYVPSPRRRSEGGGGPLRRFFDRRGFSRVAGVAALLPAAHASPGAVREAVAAGAAAVLVAGALPAGSLAPSEPVAVPVLGLEPAVAETTLTLLARGVGVTLAVGAAGSAANGEVGTTAPFSSQGLAFDSGLEPTLSAAGVGLATAEPRRGVGGTAEYGVVSGTSASAALVAGAAALLAQARPDLDAAGLRSALVATAASLGSRRSGGVGLADPAAAAGVEIVADPPTIALGAALAPGAELGREIAVRNVSRRTLSVEVAPGRVLPAGVTLDVSPRRLVLKPGARAPIAVSVRVPRLPRSPGALDGTVVVRVSHGGSVRVPWSLAVRPAKERLIGKLGLSARSFTPTDVRPPVLEVVAGRVEGPPARPQILPLERLEVALLKGGTVVGPLALLRDVLPGRYAFGLTGRSPLGKRLRPGDYAVRVTAVPVGGGDADTRTIAFSIR